MLKFDMAEKALVFYSTNAKGEEKAEAITYEESYADDAHAVQAVSAEVKAHGGATRGALTLLVRRLLSHPTMADYAGDGADKDTGLVSDWKIPKHVRDALQATEEAVLIPMLHKDPKKGREMLSQWRAKGTYAVCKGQALRYFYFAGKLPCRYTGDTPDMTRLLPVSAMQRLLKDLQAEDPDRTLAGKVLRLHGEFDKREGMTRQELERLSYTLRAFIADVDQATNVAIANATEAESAAIGSAQMMVQTRPDALADAIKAEWDALEEEQSA